MARRNMDVIDLWRYFGALLLVAGLAGFAIVATRRFGVPGLIKPQNNRRVRIVESVMLSARQRLCLIRRDNVEHLVLIGPEGASVIERNIPARAELLTESGTPVSLSPDDPPFATPMSGPLDAEAREPAAPATPASHQNTTEQAG